MFGRQDENDTATKDQSATPVVSTGLFTSDPAPWASPTPAPPQTATPAPDTAPSLPAASPSNDYMQPATAVADTSSSQPISEPASTPTPAASSNDLLDLKQQALKQLSPLVGQLDQSAEEKFRTTMMMIQASDNQALLKDAFAAAQQISDDKQRAQALLDVINEINYFTQQTS